MGDNFRKWFRRKLRTTRKGVSVFLSCGRQQILHAELPRKEMDPAMEEYYANLMGKRDNAAEVEHGNLPDAESTAPSSQGVHKMSLAQVHSNLEKKSPTKRKNQSESESIKQMRLSDSSAEHPSQPVSPSSTDKTNLQIPLVGKLWKDSRHNRQEQASAVKRIPKKATKDIDCKGITLKRSKSFDIEFRCSSVRTSSSKSTEITVLSPQISKVSYEKTEVRCSSQESSTAGTSLPYSPTGGASDFYLKRSQYEMQATKGPINVGLPLRKCRSLIEFKATNQPSRSNSRTVHEVYTDSPKNARQYRIDKYSLSADRREEGTEGQFPRSHSTEALSTMREKLKKLQLQSIANVQRFEGVNHPPQRMRRSGSEIIILISPDQFLASTVPSPLSSASPSEMSSVPSSLKTSSIHFSQSGHHLGANMPSYSHQTTPVPSVLDHSTKDQSTEILPNEPAEQSKPIHQAENAPLDDQKQKERQSTPIDIDPVLRALSEDYVRPNAMLLPISDVDPSELDYLRATHPKNIDKLETQLVTSSAKQSSPQKDEPFDPEREQNPSQQQRYSPGRPNPFLAALDEDYVRPNAMFLPVSDVDPSEIERLDAIYRRVPHQVEESSNNHQSDEEHLNETMKGHVVLPSQESEKDN